MSDADISPVDVARVLDAAGVKYVLVGGHAANGYSGRPRLTVDVDVVVRFPKKAAAAIAKAFPKLTVLDTPVVTRFKRPNGDEAIDIIKANTAKLWPELLRLGVKHKIEKSTLIIPPVEGVLAAKLAAMISITRRMEDRQIDAGDFARIVNANEHVDLGLLARLGELAYEGGGKEILKHVADARAGRRLDF